MNRIRFRKTVPAWLAGAAVCLAALLPPLDAHALGLGEIKVKSSYNRNFLAVIPVYLDAGESGLIVEIGSQNDYSMIQIGRPPVVDSLKLAVENDPNRTGEKVIVVSSKDPISVPSFNLVIRASAGGGSIIENYFLAVDFRKSLSLELPEPEEVKTEAVKPENKKPDKTAEIPVPPAAAPVPPARIIPDQKTPDTQPIETASSVPVPGKREEAAERQPKPAAPPLPAPATPQEAKPSTPPPAPLSPATAKTVPQGKTAPIIVRTDPDASKNVIRVRPGSNLFSIARKIDPEKIGLERVVVALFMENNKSFIGNNIHGLRADASLSYTNVNRIASTISDEEARKILDSHWKARKNSEPLPVPEIPLERPVPAEAVYDFIESWKKHWMDNSAALADDYADDFTAGPGGKRKSAWLAAKREIFDSNDNLNLTIGDIKIERAGAALRATFSQTLKSDQFASSGQKILTLSPSGDGLKIIREDYKGTKTDDLRHLWTVQVASYSSRGMAEAHIARLASAGLAAYEGHSFLDISGSPNVVLAGRVSSREKAAALAKKLRKMGEASPKVVRLPFSIRVGAMEDLAEAGTIMEKLKQGGYSPYRVENAAEGKQRYFIYLGAFAKKAEAEKILPAIHAEGITPAVAIP